jgi:membrane fusion protein (multidrug efflux system)
MVSRTQVAQARGMVEQSAPIDKQVAVAQANARLAHARVEAAKAAVQLAESSVSYTKIVAPVDGFVSKLAVHEQQLLQPGSMIAMVVPSTTYVIANFKETEMSRIRPGDSVDLTIDAVSGSWQGTVVSIAPGTGARFSLMPPNNATGNFVKVVQRIPVKIAWDDDQDTSELRAGMSAEVTVHVQ